MKINSLKISNYCGIRHLDTPISSPVLLVAGPNGSGKSSLQDAIRLVLTAQLGRVSLKKDAAALIREGAESAECAITADGQPHRVTIARTGKISDSMAGTQEHPALPYVLTPRAFANASADARRVLLTQITGTTANPELVAKRLRERGLDEKLVMTAHGLLAGQSMDAVARHAATKATEARGAWKATTGEAYGEKKAEGWTAEKPEIDAGASQRLEAEAAGIDQNIEAAIKQLTISEQQLKAAADNAVALQRLQDAPSRLKRAEEKLLADRKALVKWEVKAEEGHAALAGIVKRPPLMPCPCCEAQLFNDNGTLRLWIEPEELDNSRPDPADVAEWQKNAALMQRAVTAGERDVAAAQADIVELERMPKEAQDVKAIQATIGSLQDRIKRLRADKAAVVMELHDASEAARKADQADQATEKAASYHYQARQWSLLADALSPSGIPAELLASALRPINDLLAQHALETGWMQPAIDSDMYITAGGRPYALLSESEQWRVDLMIAVTLAKLSELGIVMADRLDVLDLPSRGECIKWLQGTELETAILCGTLKSVPDSTEMLQTLWLGPAGGDKGAI